MSNRDKTYTLRVGTGDDQPTIEILLAGLAAMLDGECGCDVELTVWDASEQEEFEVQYEITKRLDLEKRS